MEDEDDDVLSCDEEELGAEWEDDLAHITDAEWEAALQIVLEKR